MILYLPSEVISSQEKLMMEFVWEVNGTDFLQKKNGEQIYSPFFSTYKGSTEVFWLFVLYPRGYSTEDEGFASLGFCTKQDVKVQFEKYFINNVSKHYGNSLKTYDECLTTDQFISLTTILSDGYLFEGKVIIGARVQSDPVPVREPKDIVLKDFIWHVKEDEFKKKLYNEQIESPQFRTYNRSTEQQWNLVVYPRGYKTPEFVATYLCYKGKSTPETFFGIYLENNSSNKHTVGFFWKIFGLDNSCLGSDQSIIARDTVLDGSKGFITNGIIKIGVSLYTDRSVENIKQSENCSPCSFKITEVIKNYSTTITNTTTLTNRTIEV